MCIFAAPKKDKSEGQPCLELTTEARHDFGNIPEMGGPVSHMFTFTNAGDAPLVITSATAQCGCTRPQAPTTPVKPGHKSYIKVTYLPEGRPGSFTKKIKVRTNDPQHKTLHLTIRGTVIP